MALAYAVVLVDVELWKRDAREAVAAAQKAADEKFERLAQQAMKGLVTRNPEPRVMTYPEMRNAFPEAVLDHVIGLYFTADIT